MTKKAVILANGAFPKKQHLLNTLKTAEYLICCDGAINKLSDFGVTPYAIVGDLDSIGTDLRDKYSSILHHFAEQYTNDLSKAVNWCIERGFKQLTILGATGKREDHTIGNIFLLLRYAEKVKIKMISDYGVFTPILKDTTFESHAGQQVSIFSPNNTIKISTKNLRYPIKNASLPELWNGTLNESISSTFDIQTSGGAVIIYQAD